MSERNSIYVKAGSWEKVIKLPFPVPDTSKGLPLFAVQTLPALALLASIVAVVDVMSRQPWGAWVLGTIGGVAVAAFLLGALWNARVQVVAFLGFLATLAAFGLMVALALILVG